MRLLRYIGRRLVFLVPQLVVVSMIVFFLIRLLPGDPAYLLAGQFATPDRIAEIRHDLRLDRPLLEQYFIYVDRVAHGDFGTSWRTSQSVLTDVAQRLPATLELIILSGVGSVRDRGSDRHLDGGAAQGHPRPAAVRLWHARRVGSRFLARPHPDLLLLLGAQLGPGSDRAARPGLRRAAADHRDDCGRRAARRAMGHVRVGRRASRAAGRHPDARLHVAHHQERPRDDAGDAGVRVRAARARTRPEPADAAALCDPQCDGAAWSP